MADGDNLKVKNPVKKIFEDMEYGFKDETSRLHWISENQGWINSVVRHVGKIMQLNILGTGVYFSDAHDLKLNYSETVNKEWLNTDKFCRIQILETLASLLEKNSVLFGQLDAMERNIPLQNVLQNDIPYFIQYFRQCAVMPLRLSMLIKNMNGNTDHIDSVKISQLFPLYDICWNISPYLICGNTVKLIVDEKSILVTLLFFKLCHEAGIPEDVIRLESIESVNGTSNSSGQSMALVFDCVDIVSAVDSIIEGAWFHHGLVPWSIRRVLVQEPIYDDFIKKLLIKMKKLKSGDVFSRFTDFSKPLCSEISSALQMIVSEADSEGLKVHQVEGSDEDYLKPTVIIGRPQCLFENILPLPVMTVEAFRTVEESIKLAKNGHLFTSASLWTNSYSVLQKATLLLMKETGIQTIWRNTHGVLDPSVPFLLQDSAHCVEEDLRSYLFKTSFPNLTVLFNPETPVIAARVDQDIFNMQKIDDLLAASSKAQISWYNLGPLKHSLILSSIAMKLLEKKRELESFLPIKTAKTESVESLVEFIINVSSLNRNIINYSANTARRDSVIISNKHRGVVLLHIDRIKCIFVFLQLLFSIIAYGNSVIIITYETNIIRNFFDTLKCDLPTDLVKILSCDKLNPQSTDDNNEVTPSLEVLTAKSFISKTDWS